MCDDGWLETNGYILLVGGEFGLPSLPVVNGLPSEFGVCDIQCLMPLCRLVVHSVQYFEQSSCSNGLPLYHPNRPILINSFGYHQWQMLFNYSVFLSLDFLITISNHKQVDLCIQFNRRLPQLLILTRHFRWTLIAQ